MQTFHFALLAFSVLMNLISCAVIRNDFCKKRVKSNADLYLFNACSAAASLVCFTAQGAAMHTLRAPTPYTLGMGAVFGAATAFCAVLAMKALRSGPLSYTNVIVFCSMVIPSLSGLALYGEPVGPGQYAGIALMLLSFVLAVDRGKGGAGASVRWLLLCLGAFLCNGAVGVLQKVHQNSADKDRSVPFLLTAFTVYALISLALYLRYRRGAGEPLTVLGPGRNARFAVYAAVSGGGIAVCNAVNLYLAGAMPAAVFYPVFNGAAMLLTSVIGLVFFKEKLTRRQWAGLAAGSAAILLLCGAAGV